MKFTLKDFDKAVSNSVCDGCSRSTIVRTRGGAVKVYCHYLESTIRTPIEACSSISKIGELSLWDMKQMAWLIDADPKRKPGFGWTKPEGSSEKRKKLMRDVDPTDNDF